jgi:hypothetical protein
MLRRYEIQPVKTYATSATAEKAIERMMDKNTGIRAYLKEQGKTLTYSIIYNEEGRCYPIFFGLIAIDVGIPHLGFNCIAIS